MSWFEVLQFAALTVVAVVAALAGWICGVWHYRQRKSRSGFVEPAFSTKAQKSDAWNRHQLDLKRRRDNYTVCAWCGLKYDKESREVYATQPGWAPFFKSHGICADCEAVERARLGIEGHTKARRHEE